MKLLISHAYAIDNKGDAAILAAQVQELRRVLPDASLDIMTLDHLSEGQRFEGVPLTNALMFHVYYSGLPPVLKFLHVLVMITLTLAWAALQRLGVTIPMPRAWQRPLALLRGATLQVAVGGGYLRGKADLVSTVTLALLVHQILLARLLGVPTVLYAQSFGPYFGLTQRALARAAFRAARLILVRERTSLAQLRDLGVPQDKIEDVPDTAFLFQSDARADIRAVFPTPPRKVVGITVRQWLAPAAQARYEAAITGFARHVAHLGWSVAIIPQVTADRHNDDDRLVGQRVKAQLGDVPLVVNLDDRLDHHQVKALYAGLDFLVGTRFHSVIFALSEGVPCLAVEYEHKTSGIMNALGLGEWCLPIDGVTSEQLRTMFTALVASEADIHRQLAAVMPDVRRAARHGADRIAALTAVPSARPASRTALD